MTREIILVEVVTKSDMSTDKGRAFTRLYDAEKYFIGLVKEISPNIDEDELDCALDEGYYDVKISFPTPLPPVEKSIIIKDITLEED